MNRHALAFALSAVLMAPASGSAVEPPAPADLQLLPLAFAAGRPPSSGSVAAAEELAVLRWLQRFRTPEQIADSWLLLDRNTNLFSRALGVDMAKSTPVLNRYLRAMLNQVDAASATIKQQVRRPRPYLSHPDLQPCLPPESGFSFPSGHASWYAAAAELLAVLLPERRERLMAVGQHGGASRVMCGVHYPSDVEAGLRLGRAAALQLQASGEWQRMRDDPALRQELEMLRRLSTGAFPLLVY